MFIWWMAAASVVLVVVLVMIIIISIFISLVLPISADPVVPQLHFGKCGYVFYKYLRASNEAQRSSGYIPSNMHC